MNKSKLPQTNLAIPDKAMDQHQFEQMIKEVEGGPFYSMNELKMALAKWKAKHQSADANTPSSA